MPNRAESEGDEMSNTLYCQSLFNEIITCQAAISQATDYAAGVMRGDLRNLLREYATSDMVIFRCPVHGYFWFDVSLAHHASIGCEGDTSHPIERLLADGTWQSEIERRQLNLRRWQE